MITPEAILNTTLIFTIFGYVLGIGFSCYGLYLNYQQAKVRKITEETLQSIQHIEKLLEDHYGKNKDE